VHRLLDAPLRRSGAARDPRAVPPRGGFGAALREWRSSRLGTDKHDMLGGAGGWAGCPACRSLPAAPPHFRAHRPDAGFLDAMIYQEFQLRLPELLLMRVDKISMANSIEARVPFLDHRLVEFTATSRPP
jgi:hypothetical protein